MIEKKHIPNLLTFARGIITFGCFPLFFIDFEGKFLWILLLFLIASITDFFDGYFARKWNVVSSFGIVFDSLLDKLLILSFFFLLSPYEQLPSIIFLLLFVREIIVDGVKNYLLSLSSPLPSIFIGKLKMVFQILLIVFCLLFLQFPEFTILHIGILIFGILSLISSYMSGYTYIKIFIKHLS